MLTSTCRDKHLRIESIAQLWEIKEADKHQPFHDFIRTIRKYVVQVYWSRPAGNGTRIFIIYTARLCSMICDPCSLCANDVTLNLHNSHVCTVSLRFLGQKSASPLLCNVENHVTQHYTHPILRPIKFIKRIICSFRMDVGPDCSSCRCNCVSSDLMVKCVVYRLQCYGTDPAHSIFF